MFSPTLIRALALFLIAIGSLACQSERGKQSNPEPAEVEVSRPIPSTPVIDAAAVMVHEAVPPDAMDLADELAEFLPKDTHPMGRHAAQLIGGEEAIEYLIDRRRGVLFYRNGTDYSDNAPRPTAAHLCGKSLSTVIEELEEELIGGRNLESFGCTGVDQVECVFYGEHDSDDIRLVFMEQAGKPVLYSISLTWMTAGGESDNFKMLSRQRDRALAKFAKKRCPAPRKRKP